MTCVYFNVQGIIFYEKERVSVHPKTVLPLEIGGTKRGPDELKAFFGSKVLDLPNPTALIQYLIKHACTNKDDLILDFFVGSSTKAHAVMELNASDGGNRKFIMVQLPELCDENSEAYKTGYKNICDIGLERICRAGAQIAEKHQTE